MEEALYVLYFEGKPLKLRQFRIKCAYDTEVRARQVVNGVLRQKAEIDPEKVTIVKYVREA